jgi:cobalt-zinc-cadmium efflux system membrane fusion protein
MREPTSSLTHVPVSTTPPARRTWAGLLAGVAVVAVILVLACTAGAFWLGLIRLPGHALSGDEGQEQARQPLNVELIPNRPHTLKVPENTRAALGIRKGGRDQLVEAVPPRKGRPLVLPGSTMLDPARILRLRARFAPAEVVRVARLSDIDKNWSRSQTDDRELRPGDRLKTADVLGVFYSVDVGNQKNNLFDAVVQLKLDEDILRKAESARGSVPEAFVLQAQRNVQGDYNNINRAENTLRAWSIPEDEIRAVRREAEQAAESSSAQRQRVTQDQLDRWARVTLKAPPTDDGVPWTLIERNVAEHEIIVDNTTNLFVLAKVDRLGILAYAPEDDLPTLENLKPEQRRWTIQTVGAGQRGIDGAIDEIGYLIDPNQHTAVLKGHIDNPGGRLRGGQYITCTIDLPPPKNTVQVPMSAVVDDGKQTVVFVQEDPAKPGVYTMRRVRVTARFEATAFVSSRPRWWVSQLLAPLVSRRLQDNELVRFVGGFGRRFLEGVLGEMPVEPLRPGEMVLPQGALELKKELEDREPSPGAARQ